MAVRRESKVRAGAGTLFGVVRSTPGSQRDKVGEAAGVGRQIEACRHLTEVEGWSIDEGLVDNDLSAYSGACRTEYERLLDPVRRREIDVIVAYHPDRLYRRLADLVELTKVIASAGAEIRTVAAGHVDLNMASGRFTAQVLGAAAHANGSVPSIARTRSAATPTAAAAPTATDNSHRGIPDLRGGVMVSWMPKGSHRPSRVE